MKQITINGKPLDEAALVAGTLPWVGQTEAERSALEIIKAWLSGQKSFAFNTSGSTGVPKICTFSREQLINSARRTLDFFQLAEGATAVCCLNTAFVAGYMMIIRALVGRLNLIVIDPTAEPWPALQNENGVDFMAITPQQAESGLRKHRYSMAGVKTLLVGGAGIHPDLQRGLTGFPGCIYHSYAMTETLTHIAVRRINGTQASDIYKALNGVTFSTNENNCLKIQDDILGIYGLQTTDVVDLEDEHSFKWVGRSDNIINSGGIKIQTELLEKMIGEVLARSGVSAIFCLLPVPDPQLTNRVVLLVEDPETTLTSAALLVQLKKHLPRYHCPTEIIFVPHIILTKTGKVDRKMNASHYLQSRTS